MKKVTIKRIEPTFVDVRGEIIDLLDDVVIRHIGLITSKANTIRGSHYHIKQTQHNYVLSGKIKLITWNVGTPDDLTVNILEPGDMVFIPNGIAHKMEFLDDSIFLDLNSESRSSNGYEKDTIRIK